MRQVLCLLILFICGFSFPVSAQTPNTESSAAWLLEKQIDSVNWIDFTLEEVIEWLKEQAEERVNVVPRWTHLEIENVTREDLLTLQLNNSTVADVLNETLEQLNDDDQLRFRAIGNNLRISTRTDFERKLYNRVYNVTDILFDVPNFEQQAPIIDLQNINQQGSGGSGGGGRGVFVQGGGQTGGRGLTQQGQGEQAFKQKLDKLRELIIKVIAPDSWEETGAGRGQIETFNRSLVVLNTIEVHEEIAGYFSLAE